MQNHYKYIIIAKNTNSRAHAVRVRHVVVVHVTVTVHAQHVRIAGTIPVTRRKELSPFLLFGTSKLTKMVNPKLLVLASQLNGWPGYHQ